VTNGESEMTKIFISILLLFPGNLYRQAAQNKTQSTHVRPDPCEAVRNNAVAFSNCEDARKHVYICLTPNPLRTIRPEGLVIYPCDVASYKDDVLSDEDADLLDRLETVIGNYGALEVAHESERLDAGKDDKGWDKMMANVQTGYETLTEEIRLHHPHMMMVDIDKALSHDVPRTLSSCGNVR
jgi:hypothetical protein